MDPTELRWRVDALAAEPDRMRRRLVALGALTARLAPQGIEPTLVGGCAMEVYTDGGYTTGDVDLALPAGSGAGGAARRARPPGGAPRPGSPDPAAAGRVSGGRYARAGPV